MDAIPRGTERPSPLRARRLLRGLRLRDVELATGIPDTTVSRLERGELSLIGRRLVRLAAFYATPPKAIRDEMDRYTASRSAQNASTGLDELEPPRPEASGGAEWEGRPGST